MNDFFDRLGNAARRAAGNVAGEVSIAAEKQKLSDAYRALGKLCYEAMKRDMELINEQGDKLSLMSENLAALNQKIDFLSHKQ